MFTQEQINNVVNTIKKVSNPTAIYLFGSYASGSQTDNSDLDIAIIKSEINDEFKEAFNIRKALFGNGISMDLLFFEEKNYKSRTAVLGTVQYEIENKGKRLL